MNKLGLTNSDKWLVKIAKDLINNRKSRLSTVGCALRTKDGKIFKGVSIEPRHSGPCHSCAEYSAIGTMLTESDYQIETIVAVGEEGTILPPCGRCREMLKEFRNPYVIMQKDSKLFKVKLDEIIPYWESK
jgi:cytidine deaminase